MPGPSRLLVAVALLECTCWCTRATTAPTAPPAQRTDGTDGLHHNTHGSVPDPPIEGASRVYLDGAWSATGYTRTFPATTTCFNGTRQWLPNPSDYTVDWATNARGLCGR